MLVLAPFAIGLEPMAPRWLIIEEHKAPRIDATLTHLPAVPFAGDVRSLLLTGQRGFMEWPATLAGAELRCRLDEGKGADQ